MILRKNRNLSKRPYGLEYHNQREKGVKGKGDRSWGAESTEQIRKKLHNT